MTKEPPRWPQPHVPWEFPHEFLAHYPADLDDIPLASDTYAPPFPPSVPVPTFCSCLLFTPSSCGRYAPAGMPDAAWHWPADVHGMNGTGTFNETCNATRSRVFRRA